MSAGATIDRDIALKAVDKAFTEGLKHTYGVLVQGLIVGSNRDELTQRFQRGLAHHCAGHAEAVAAVVDYFAREGVG